MRKGKDVHVEPQAEREADRPPRGAARERRSAAATTSRVRTVEVARHAWDDEPT